MGFFEDFDSLLKSGCASLSAPEVQCTGERGGGKAAGFHTGAVREGVTWWYP